MSPLAPAPSGALFWLRCPACRAEGFWFYDFEPGEASFPCSIKQGFTAYFTLPPKVYIDGREVPSDVLRAGSH